MSYATAPVIVGKVRAHTGHPAFGLWCQEIDSLLGSGSCAKQSPQRLHALYDQGLPSGRAAALLALPSNLPLSQGSPTMTGWVRTHAGQIVWGNPDPNNKPYPASFPMPAWGGTHPGGIQPPRGQAGQDKTGWVKTHAGWVRVHAGQAEIGPFHILPTSALVAAGAKLVAALQAYGCSGAIGPCRAFQQAYNAWGFGAGWGGPASLPVSGGFDASSQSALQIVTGKLMPVCIGAPTQAPGSSIPIPTPLALSPGLVPAHLQHLVGVAPGGRPPPPPPPWPVPHPIARVGAAPTASTRRYDVPWRGGVKPPRHMAVPAHFDPGYGMVCSESVNCEEDPDCCGPNCGCSHCVESLQCQPWNGPQDINAAMQPTAPRLRTRPSLEKTAGWVQTRAGSVQTGCCGTQVGQSRPVPPPTVPDPSDPINPFHPNCRDHYDCKPHGPCTITTSCYP